MTIIRADEARRRIMLCLSCMPSTTRQIMERTKLPKGHVTYGVQMLKEMEVIQIRGYVKDSQNRNVAIYEPTGKEIPDPAGKNWPSNDRDRIETDDQAEAFAARLYAAHPNGYDSVIEGSDVRRFNLTRNHGHAQSSMTWA